MSVARIESSRWSMNLPMPVQEDAEFKKKQQEEAKKLKEAKEKATAKGPMGG